MFENHIFFGPDSDNNNNIQIDSFPQPTKIQTGSIINTKKGVMFDISTCSIDTSIIVTLPNTLINISSSSIESNDNIINQKILNEFKQKYTQEFLNLILEDDFEYGYSSQSETFVKKLFNINTLITKEWLNTIFIDYFNDTRIIIGLLHIISHLNYYKIYPQGQTMAIAALSHTSSQVIECGIRVFENWGTSDSLKLLKNVQCRDMWLQEYVEQVILDLEEELGGDVAAC